MKKARKERDFFRHPQMDFEFRIALGSCAYGAAEPGELLAASSRIAAGDCESWFQEWHALAERVGGIAQNCLEAGNRESACWAFLRSAGYYSLANSMADGSADPSRLLSTWKKSRECWDRFCELLRPPAERVEIPYGQTALPGYFFTPAGGGPRPVVIFANGSDGPTHAMWASGIAGALERGYAALTFDGPGQNALLWLQNIPFRPDWEEVIGPVVDYLLLRPDIDPDRIALSGISQGGYWVLRALAFERRLAAGIADPGVMDVSAAMISRFPPEMLELLDSGRQEEFDRFFAESVRNAPPAARQELEFRMKPYGVKSCFDWISAARQYHLRDVIEKIRCPVFIADPEDEQFWPGQPAEVYAALRCPKTIVRFTREEGANLHCQPLARRFYDQRMFDWLASVLGPAKAAARKGS